MKTLITFVAIALLSVTSFAQETQQKKASLSDAEQLHIAVQKICPVSGQELGSMGDPIQACLLYTSPSPRDATLSRMPSSA